MPTDPAFKAKRKWQTTLRRYVLEEQACPSYAPYFGLPIILFREWIASQFDENISWDNFSIAWQFDHIVPVSCFDFDNDDEMRLCWNFTNISVSRISVATTDEHQLDILAAKQYFINLASKTDYYVCTRMIAKIELLEQNQLSRIQGRYQFVDKYNQSLDQLANFSKADFERANWGMSVEDVIAENSLLAKFGRNVSR